MELRGMCVLQFISIVIYITESVEIGLLTAINRKTALMPCLICTFLLVQNFHNSVCAIDILFAVIKKQLLLYFKKICYNDANKQ